jgi:aspartyl-tRNA(Asn)/glutamyl-tRNA(Gln) amidotransferase subunit B
MRLPPQGLAELVTLIGSGKITGKIGKEILPELVDSWEGSVIGLVRERGMEAITDPAVIRQLVETVVAANADKVADYRQVLSV